ncbi:uncharacterized protein B0H18DRAFT_1127676 [Fomitopsis serialis]|uniref:uncharacterized protein n=1 Tax=Fomitopsis serialis TaxID=139415 RepID=UPI002007628F|nr:uncharacterized protein B0H18DRAFT_1127676 [Neoantrodia serialis]KAH9912080.1 hypothetical protein B0H18DRAFT_1127676 [Neoantrodia serialis]
MTPCALPLFHVRLVSYSHLPVRMHRLNVHLRPLHQPFHSIPYRTTPRNDHQRSSPPPDGDDLQFLDIQLGPASTNLEVDEFLQLRAVRRCALSAERAARSAEAKLAELVRTAAKALLSPSRGDMGMDMDTSDDPSAAARSFQRLVASFCELPSPHRVQRPPPDQGRYPEEAGTEEPRRPDTPSGDSELEEAAPSLFVDPIAISKSVTPAASVNGEGEDMSMLDSPAMDVNVPSSAVGSPAASSRRYTPPPTPTDDRYDPYPTTNKRRAVSIHQLRSGQPAILVHPVQGCASVSLLVLCRRCKRVAPEQLARALHPLFAGEVQQSPRFMQRIASKHAFTMHVMENTLPADAGAHTHFVSSQPQQATPTFAFPPVSVSINHSTPQLSLNPAASGLVRSSLKDFAVAVLPAPLVASTSSSQPAATPSSHQADPVTSVDAPSECACGCELITWPGKSKGTANLMLRSAPATSAAHDNGKSSLAMVSSHARYAADGGKGKAAACGGGTMFALSA